MSEQEPETVSLINMDKHQQWVRYSWRPAVYTIDVPADWEIDSRPDTTVFTAPQNAASFAVTVYSNVNGNLERFLAARTSVDNTVLIPVEPSYKAFGTNWEGIAQEFCGTFPGDSHPTYRWNVCLQYEEVFISITLHTHPLVVEACRPLLGHIFASLQITEKS